MQIDNIFRECMELRKYFGTDGHDKVEVVEEPKYSEGNNGFVSEYLFLPVLDGMRYFDEENSKYPRGLGKYIAEAIAGEEGSISTIERNSNTHYIIQKKRIKE
jgi:hypothetical protein